MITKQPIFVAGKWIQTAGEISVRDPWTGKITARVSAAGEEEIEKAIRSAVEAFSRYRNWASFERAGLLQRIHDGVRKEAEPLAQLILRESGKPITLARGEVSRTLHTFQTAAEEARRFGGDLLPLDLQSDSRGRFGLYRRFPIGPVLAITPFNFPLNLAAHKVAPALAVGNAVLLKPAPQTPISVLRLARICEKAGLPPGVMSVLPAGPEAIRPAIKDPRIQMISFTGSAAVGWGLKEASGKKKVVLEMGGNAAVLVDQDADLKAAARRIARGAFVYAGQTCISVQRILIHQKVYAPFLRRFLSVTRKEIKTGNPRDPRVLAGPLINLEAVERVLSWIEEAKRAGAKILAGGRKRGKNFIEPTVLEKVPHGLPLSGQEVFGPVVLVEPVENFSEAVRRANDTRYGLQCGVFTNTLDHVLEAYEKLDVGGVMINDYSTYRSDPMPYGGTKDSGFGREGVRYAMEEMTEPKLLVVRKSRWEN